MGKSLLSALFYCNHANGALCRSPGLENLRPTHWILEVDETPVNSIQELLQVVEEKKWEQGKYITIKQVNRKGITSVVSVKVDDRFWPCMSWTKVPGTTQWVQKRHTGDALVQPLEWTVSAPVEEEDGAVTQEDDSEEAGEPTEDDDSALVSSVAA